MNIQWNAERYSEHFQFVHQYGRDVFSLIDAPSGAFVVDLGCGNGALSAQLNEMGFHVLGIDASPEMLATARREHPDLDFLLADAINFTLNTPADVIFSNAVFHWIDAAQQNRMLKNLASQLKKGGQLVCEFGGKGCAEQVHSCLERAFQRRGLYYRRMFYFPSIGEYTSRMEACGFKTVYAILFDRFTRQESKNGLTDWIRMFVTEPFRDLDPETEQEILKEAEEELRPSLYQNGNWYIDYVRIRLKAVKQ